MAEYIEREALIKEIVDIINTAPMIYVGGLGLALTSVRSAPAADVAPVRHGRWYRFQKVYIDPQSGYGFGRDMYKCDVCNVGEEETRTPYCPNCGAKMQGDANE